MKIIIVGGVAGGAAAAARLRRLNESATISMFERGEYISFANCGLPYYAGDIIKEREKLLVQTVAQFEKRFNVDVRTNVCVERIDREKRIVIAKDLKTGTSTEEQYDFIVLSPGADPILPNIPGVDFSGIHTVQTIPDIDNIKKKLDAGINSVVIVGGGFIGIEMAENIRERNIDVSLIEKLDQVMPSFDKEMAVILNRELHAHGIALYLRTEVVAVEKTPETLKVVTSTGKRIPADMVIFAVGVRPEIKLAKEAGLNIGQRGIVVDKQMRTSDPAIFAVGDAVEVVDLVNEGRRYVPLAGPAAKQARVAANAICGITDEYAGVIGTSVVKVFSLTAAMTGMSEKMLIASHRSYEKIYTHPVNHAGYYPGASAMTMKIVFDLKDGVVLGAQIIGGEGVDKRIDILATAVQHKLTMHDLANLELCYAPPYGSAKDAINLAGMAAINHMQGISKLIHWDALTGDEVLLDVRTPNEYKKGSASGAVNIPVDILRQSLGAIAKDKKIAVFCQVGVRAHIATRILVEHEFDAYNISGGYKTFCQVSESAEITRGK